MAGTKKIDKTCEDCGTLLVQVAPTRKLCYACEKKRRQARQKKYQTVKQKKEKPALQGAPIQNPNAKYCKGCIYWGGDYAANYCCNYIFIKGHRRPCPAGKDCTEKIVGKRKRTMEFGENRG